MRALLKEAQMACEIQHKTTFAKGSNFVINFNYTKIYNKLKLY